MNVLFRAVIATALALLPAVAARAVDMTWTYAVQLSATVSADPPRIELNWPADPFPISRYTVHRKAPAENAWNEGVPLSGDATRFTDENVEVGKTYEYQVIKYGPNYTGFGYITVGLHAPLVDARGRVILVVDDSFAGPLAGEIARLQSDLAGDGWTVLRRDVSRGASPEEVKAAIRREYNADKENTRAVFLLGRIPIVLSGNLNVDGHGSRPMPADVFYGDMDGEWTDANGDGVYDQSLQPSEVELQVGRVDFADLPGRYSPVPYPGEVELMKRYLDKNHAYRHAAVRPRHRGLIGGLGDGNGQAYSAAAFRNFSALVGNTNVAIANSEADASLDERWITRLSADDYLWAFGGGAGSDFTVGALGRHGPYADLWASDFIEHRPKGTFYLMFGSWFADWSKPDNLLRTVLASPEHSLAAAWSGRPHLFFHHMGAGETLGYGIRLSQNNAGLYQNQVQRQLRGVHISLLGDPTLRMHQVAPPTDVNASAQGGEVALTWRASSDAVLGYHVYRSTSPDGPFTRLTDGVITDTRFIDSRRLGDATIYQVRAIALTSGPSGSFFNASQAATVMVGGSGVVSEAFIDPRASDTTKPTDVVWVDDALPAGANGYAEADRWNWITTNPVPFSGARAHQADLAPGRHHHFFGPAATPLAINSGDTLFVYVYLDPSNPPRQVMVTWLADDWEHRAYWGENLIEEGVDGTPSRRHMGPLPEAGKWVRLEVPANAVGMENRHAVGMGFTLYDGRATWDRAGKSR